jgi:hypothetical protein
MSSSLTPKSNLVTTIFRLPRVVYLETSAWDELQRRGALASSEAIALKAASSRYDLRIVTGVMTFEETFPYYLRDSSKAVERLELLATLSDLRKTVDLGLLRHRIYAAILNQVPQDPYTDLADVLELRRILLATRSLATRSLGSVLACGIPHGRGFKRELARGGNRGQRVTPGHTLVRS